MSTSRIHHAGISGGESRDADAENLSALFDGQLRDDAARFALKRLGHDTAWREACGRWQLAGDVLRGHAGVAAPTGFAERVIAAVAQEHPDMQSPSSIGPVVVKAPVRAHRRWIGGAALAASVAMAALFVVRPVFQAGAPEIDASRQTLAVDSGTADPASSAPAPLTVADAMAGGVNQPDAVADALVLQDAGTVPDESPAGGVALMAAAAMAVADVPRRAGERRARGQAQRAALRGSQNRQREAINAVASTAGGNTGAAPAAVATEAGALATAGLEPKPALRPFMPAGEVVSRPWPRAVLPHYAAAGALTASYHEAGDAGPGSPSFYPFGPQALQDHASAAPPQDVRSAEWPQP